MIFAADVEVRGRERFAGKPVVQFSVKAPISDAEGVFIAAVAAVESHSTIADYTADEVEAVQAMAGPASKVAVGGGVGTRVRQWLMTGVSYMIPFVAAGGIMIALSFMIGGYSINTVTAADLVANFSLTSKHDWAGPLFVGGSTAFGFLVAVLAGFIAYAIADRPGIAPGFVGGALCVAVGAGFLGGLVIGFAAGFVALGISRLNVPASIRSVMPVVVTPLVSTLLISFLTVVVLGKPLAALMDALTNGLNALSGAGIIVLGVILGLMQASDMGGPINKVAYTFATTGLVAVGTSAAADAPQLKIMAAVMAAGMIPPLGLALATVLRKTLFSEAERHNGKAAWVLGASFITEGAIPFAAVDPLRVIPSACSAPASRAVWSWCSDRSCAPRTAGSG